MTNENQTPQNQTIKIVDNSEGIKKIMAMLIEKRESSSTKTWENIAGRQIPQFLKRVYDLNREKLGDLEKPTLERIINQSSKVYRKEIIMGNISRSNQEDRAYKILKETGKKVLKEEDEKKRRPIIVVGRPVEQSNPNPQEDYNTPGNKNQEDKEINPNSDAPYQAERNPQPLNPESNKFSDENENPALFNQIRDLAERRAGWEINNFNPEENQAAIASVSSRIYNKFRGNEISEIRLKKEISKELKREFGLEEEPRNSLGSSVQTASQYAGIEIQPKKRLKGLSKLVAAGAIIAGGVLGAIFYRGKQEENPESALYDAVSTDMEPLPAPKLVPKPQTTSKSPKKQKNPVVAVLDVSKKTEKEQESQKLKKKREIANRFYEGVSQERETSASKLAVVLENQKILEKINNNTNAIGETARALKNTGDYYNGAVKKIEKTIKEIKEKIKEYSHNLAELAKTGKERGNDVKRLEKAFTEYQILIKKRKSLLEQKVFPFTPEKDARTPEEQARENLYGKINPVSPNPKAETSSKIKVSQTSPKPKQSKQKLIPVIPYEFPSKDFSIYAGKRFSNDGDASTAGIDYSQKFNEDSKWFWGVSGNLYEGDNNTKTPTTMSEIETKGAELEARLGRKLYQRGGFRIRGSVNLAGGLNYKDGWTKDTTRIPETQGVHEKWYNTKVGAEVDFNYKKASAKIGISKPVSGKNNSTQTSIKFGVRF